MAAMTTALTEFSDSGNSRTYTTSGHSVQKPALVMQKRKVPTGSQTVAEDTIEVLHGTVDAEGIALPTRVSMKVTVRRPIDGAQADVDAALAILRDIVAGDEFSNTVSTSEYLS